MTSRSKILAVVLLAIVAVVVWRMRSKSNEHTSSSPELPSSSAPTESRSIALPSSAPSASIEKAPPPTPGARVFGAKWGGGLGELGRERPQEGNAEGPMSFAPLSDGYVVVDQVNGRLSKYDAKGRFERAQDIAKTVQDVAVTKDGAMVLLDRLGEKKLTLLDPRGKKFAELPLTHPKLGEGGLSTGVFIDGKDVYVEKEHGILLHVGTTDGQPADEGKGKELSGRPSKDGALLLTAGLSSAKEGKAYLNALDRKSGELRFARQLAFPRPASAIVLLDSDAKGTIYVGVAAGTDPAAHVACLDGTDGHALGRIVLPLSSTPEESFRDLSVTGDGNIVFALRSEEGVEYRSVRCP